MDRIRVLLVDDHPLFRSGVRWALESCPTIRVVGEAGDGATALRQAGLLRPDVVLCDLNMPGMDGLEVTRSLTRAYPRLAVVILTLHQDDARRTRALEAGAAAFLSKGLPAPELLDALERVARGERLIEEAFLPRRPADPFDEPTLSLALSPRERDVLACIARGESNKEIARRLGISVQTVKNHVTTILRKLGVSDRTEAVIHAVRRGWVSGHDGPAGEPGAVGARVSAAAVVRATVARAASRHVDGAAAEV